MKQILKYWNSILTIIVIMMSGVSCSWKKNDFYQTNYNRWFTTNQLTILKKNFVANEVDTGPDRTWQTLFHFSGTSNDFNKTTESCLFYRYPSQKVYRDLFTVQTNLLGEIKVVEIPSYASQKKCQDFLLSDSPSKLQNIYKVIFSINKDEKTLRMDIDFVDVNKKTKYSEKMVFNLNNLRPDNPIVYPITKVSDWQLPQSTTVLAAIPDECGGHQQVACLRGREFSPTTSTATKLQDGTLYFCQEGLHLNKGSDYQPICL